MDESIYFTVRELLNLTVLQKAEVLGGHQGLDRQIVNVTVLDAPDAINWVKENELIITTMYPFKEIESQKRLIRELAGKGSSAIGIKLKRYIDSVPEDVLKMANQYSLPVISIPYECAWVDLINPIMAEILNRQLIKLEISERIHKSFTEEYLRDGELDSIAKKLFGLINKAITISELVSYTSTTYPQKVLDSYQESLMRELLATQKTQSMDTVKFENLVENTELLVFPIKITKKVEGYVVVWDTKNLSEIDLIAVEHAVTVSALQIHKLKAITEAGRRFKDDLINILLKGDSLASFNAKKRSLELGWKLGTHNLVIVITILNTKVYREGWMEVQHLYEIVNRLLLKHNLGTVPFGVDRSDRIVILLSRDEHESIPILASDLAEKIREEIIKDKSVKLKVGIGIGGHRQHIKDIPESFEEGCIASKVALLNKSPVSFAEYGQLGIFVLLNELRDQRVTEGFLRDTIRPVEEYDREYGSELLTTLESFLENDCNYRRTAKALYMHHNTIRYRISLIENISKIDLANPGDKLKMYAAVKLFKLAQL